MGVNDPLAKCFRNLTKQSLTTSTVRPQGVYLFREKCQTKELTIYVLLDGGERPLSKMLEESLKQQQTRSPCPQWDRGYVFVSRKCQTKGLTISVLLDGSERPLSKMLEESLKQQKTRSPCPQWDRGYVFVSRNMQDQRAHHFCSAWWGGDEGPLSKMLTESKQHSLTMSTTRPTCVYLFHKKCQTKYLTISVLLDRGDDPQAPYLKNLRNSLTTSTIIPKGVYLFRERCQATGLTISVLLDGGGATLKHHA